MARLYPTLLVVPLLLAACAGSSSSPTQDDPAYLQALSSDYSIRSDELESEGFEKLREELPESLVAGNGELTVAAAMFQMNGYLTVDLVVYNHSGEPLEISRADMYVLDYMGTRLAPIEEWEGAENYGLRSSVQRDTEYVYLEGNEAVPDRFGQTPASSGTGKTGDGERGIPVYDSGNDLDNMFTEPVEIRQPKVTAPPILTIASGEKRPYWAYFETKNIVYPLSAIVRLDGNRLIFRFEGP